VRILLVRLRLIGDVVFTTPAISALRRTFPEAHLAYLVEPAAAPVVQFSPDLNDVIVAPMVQGWRRTGTDLQLAQRLRRARYDWVIDFHGGPRAAWLAWASGAPRRVGYTIPGRTWMYTDRVPRAPGLQPRHSVENQWDLLASVSPALARPPHPSHDPVRMSESPAAAAAMAARLEVAGVTSAHELIVIHVSAGNPFRRWPADFFVELGVRLGVGGRNRRIILTSGPSDVQAARDIGVRIRAGLGTGAAAMIAAGDEYSLAELRSLIARASLFIGGDSGPMHIAATTEVPIVGIYGPTLPVRSAPWRPKTLITESVELADLACRPCDQRRCVPGDFRCLARLSPQLVVEAAERALARRVTAVRDR
jgi:lipopolysaccharide heptosyltransferase II